MTVVQNIQVKLDVSKDAHSLLDETFEQFRHAAQYVSEYGWDDDPTEIIDDQKQLNAATYDEVRELTDLHANHVQSARSLASTALGNCQDRILDKGKRQASPHSVEQSSSTVLVRSRTMTTTVR